jgi:hypothetical protein
MTNLTSLQDKYLQSNFPRWMFWSRIAQVVFSIFIFGLCAAVINQSKTDPYFAIPTFNGLNMFSAILTIIIVPYTSIAPRRLPNFYHVYVEVVLEFFLFFFWFVSFASMADYVGSYNWALNLESYGVDPSDRAEIQADLDNIMPNINKAMSCLKAVTVFGALVFFLSLANFIFLVAYVVRTRRARRSSTNDTNETNVSELEMGEKSSAPPPSQMPPSFSANL